LAGSRKYDELTKEDCPSPNEIDNIHCGYHCNALSSKEGLGMSKRVVNENKIMGAALTLKKLHKLLVKMIVKSALFLNTYCRFNPKEDCNR
jgi:hypothetical protein